MTDNASFRKSSHSEGAANCVEIAPAAPHSTLIRDTKAPAHGHLAIDAGAWSFLVTFLKA
ncbi:DUF397 domain-containing protein [Streptomyces sp. SID3343]|uniref:DUF397 domain-containing protein n=1 Tax=Streptomyces sp. SID3343 TaxID=2690260 RepID=UPI00136BD987|nr:DUF397 domain-containing protein [Streptomyces sp. SID3343]MYW03188.1 DUF397 domain-containing protein [Streptomyces sp. SID3343]